MVTAAVTTAAGTLGATGGGGDGATETVMTAAAAVGSAVAATKSIAAGLASGALSVDGGGVIVVSRDAQRVWCNACGGPGADSATPLSRRIPKITEEGCGVGQLEGMQGCFHWCCPRGAQEGVGQSDVGLALTPQPL